MGVDSTQAPWLARKPQSLAQQELRRQFPCPCSGLQGCEPRVRLRSTLWVMVQRHNDFACLRSVWCNCVTATHALQTFCLRRLSHVHFEAKIGVPQLSLLARRSDRARESAARAPGGGPHSTHPISQFSTW